MPVACSVHADAPSVGRCESCHRPTCTDCMSSAHVLLTCTACAALKRGAATRRRNLMIIAVIPLLIGVGVGGWQLVSMLSPEAQAARKVAERAVVEQAAAAAEADLLLADLRKVPCSRQALIPGLEKLLNANRSELVLSEVKRFEKDCGPWSRAWWAEYGAYEQRGEFAAAADVASKLIADDPDDRDFWWWRARAHFNAGAYEKAEPDFRRVRELCPECLAGWATADTLEKLNRPCDAIAPLVQSLVMHPDLSNAKAVEQRIDRLRALPACAAVEGQGSLKLPLTGGHAYARGSVNGAKVEFVVDTGATSVAVSESMAVAMKLDGLPALAITTSTANGIVNARQVIADRIEVGHVGGDAGAGGAAARPGGPGAARHELPGPLRPRDVVGHEPGDSQPRGQADDEVAGSGTAGRRHHRQAIGARDHDALLVDEHIDGLAGHRQHIDDGRWAERQVPRGDRPAPLWCFVDVVAGDQGPRPAHRQHALAHCSRDDVLGSAVVEGGAQRGSVGDVVDEHVRRPATEVGKGQHPGVGAGEDGAVELGQLDRDVEAVQIEQRRRRGHDLCLPGAARQIADDSRGLSREDVRALRATFPDLGRAAWRFCKK